MYMMFSVRAFERALARASARVKRTNYFSRQTSLNQANECQQAEKPTHAPADRCQPAANQANISCWLGREQPLYISIEAVRVCVYVLMMMMIWIDELIDDSSLTALAQTLPSCTEPATITISMYDFKQLLRMQ